MMRDPEEWSSADVESIVAEQLAEGQRLDYKRELRLHSKSQKAELAKDVSGFANADGGLLLFGIAEDESDEPVPVEVIGVPLDGLQTRLENVLDSVLEPVPSYRAATVQMTDGRGVVVVRITPHTGPPVMVQGYGQDRYFIRSGTRTRPMRAAEVASAFAAAERAISWFQTRASELPLLAPILRQREIDELKRQGEGAESPMRAPLVSVVVGAIDLRREELLGPDAVVPESFEERMDGYRGKRLVRPLGMFDVTSWGLVAEEPCPGRPDVPTRRLAVYREGVVEWGRRFLRNADAIETGIAGFSGLYSLPSGVFPHEVHDALLYAGRIFEQLDYFGRVLIWIHLENAHRAALTAPADLDVQPRTPASSYVTHRAELHVDDLHDPTPVTRDAMHRIWQAFGLRRSWAFDATGSWAGA